MNKPLDTNATSGTGLNFTTSFATSGWNNTILTDNSLLGLANPYGDGAAFDPTPSASSVAVTGAVNSTKLSANGLQQVTYRGAVAPGGNDNWWKQWTKFD